MQFLIIQFSTVRPIIPPKLNSVPDTVVSFTQFSIVLLFIIPAIAPTLSLATKLLFSEEILIFFIILPSITPNNPTLLTDVSLKYKPFI